MSRALLRPRLRDLRADRRGATLTEFAIVAPVMCLFLIGGFDTAPTLYMRAALQGIVQNADSDEAALSIREDRAL